jgi:hypothetical protein
LVVISIVILRLFSLPTHRIVLWRSAHLLLALGASDYGNSLSLSLSLFSLSAEEADASRTTND